MSGHQQLCVLIAKLMRNKMMIYGKTIKEMFKGGWDVFPPWLLALNIFAIAIGLAVILFV
jgi:hypothetical protein